MSPPPSPELPRSRFHYTTFRYGTYTHPGPSQSLRLGTLHSDSFRRYAFSEAPRMTRPQMSTAALGSFHRRSQRQTAALQPVFASAAFQQSGDYSSHWGHNQTLVKQEKNIVQRQSGDMMLGTIQPDEGLSWLAQTRRDGQGLHRLNSHPSVASMEVDMGRQMEVELPIQQTQAHNFTIL